MVDYQQKGRNAMKIHCYQASITINGQAGTANDMNRTDLLIDGRSIFFDGRSYELPSAEKIIGKEVILSIPSSIVSGRAVSVTTITTTRGENTEDDDLATIVINLRDVEADGSYDGIVNGYSGLGDFSLDIEDDDLVETSVSTKPIKWADYCSARSAVGHYFFSFPRLNQIALRLAIENGGAPNFSQLISALPPELREKWQDLIGETEEVLADAH
jgi:hypothetical protein